MLFSTAVMMKSLKTFIALKSIKGNHCTSSQEGFQENTSKTLHIHSVRIWTNAFSVSLLIHIVPYLIFNFFSNTSFIQPIDSSKLSS